MLEGQPERPNPIHHKLENVPALKQKHINWCGYTSLSMLVQAQGYTELTPQTLFRYMNEGIYNSEQEIKSPSRGPSIGSLALAAQELTDLQVDLFDTQIYNALQEKRPTLTPYDVLEAYVVGRNAACMIRVPGHFIVVTGVDKGNDTYYYNEPRTGTRESTKKDLLDTPWASKEKEYPDKSTQYLMLTVHRKKR